MKRLFIVLEILILSISVFPTPSAKAATANEWQAGNIINDNTFTYADAMSVQDIQNFLNGLVPTCDTWGTQIASDYGSKLTHAQYAASRGWSAPPYVCLKDYYEVPKTEPGSVAPDNSFNHYDADSQTLMPVPGGVSAAQLIYNAAHKYNINPRVLLVKLRTESPGPLTNDDWPTSPMYRYAMGAHCPDSGPGGSANCDTNYAGFSLQISEAASLLRWYLDSMTQPWWSYKKPYQTNNILWNVAPTGCGGSDVFIQSKATAALYTYTPYQPNQAALSNMYGTGDGCSSYGNRNFWRIYTDWFGRPSPIPVAGCAAATGTSLSCVWKVEDNPNDAEILSTSYDDVNHMVNVNGHSFYGVSFYARNPISPQAGNIPIYSAIRPNGATFITADRSEYDGFIKSGWKDNGVIFYADPAGSNSGYQVYRLFNSKTSNYAWTADASQILSYQENGYQVQKVEFTSLSKVAQESAPPSGKALVYRFYVAATHSHMWTTDVYERDNMISAGYQYEKVAWLASTSADNKPVYRLYAPAIRQHLYTTDSSERDNLSANHGWNYEGIAFYVNQGAGSPVYRLYAPSLGVHHLTMDTNERSILLSSGKWNDEGIAWYQP